MRVIPCMLLLACLCATTTGCSLFKKNTNNTNTGGGTGGNVAPPKFPDPLLNNIPQPPTFPTTPPAGGANGPPTVQTSNSSSMLAGTVVDAYHRPIGNVYVRWINLEEKEKDGAPIDVAANASGHFIIQGLKPGTSYKLIARTKLGDKMLAGTALTTAPNVRVVIPISEDRVNSSTPPLPSGLAYQAPAQGEGKNTNFGGASKQAPNDPFLGQGKPSGEPNLPATMNVPAAPTNSQVGTSDPAFVPGVVEVPKDRLPMLNIPTPVKPNPFVPGDGKLDTGPPRVPSCVVVGSRVENLALKDSKGQTWDYRKQAAGKLVLLDFWRIDCLPCRQSVPDLNKLHQKYGSGGLEVVGVAVETDAAAVNKFCAQMQIGFRQVIGRSGSFDVSKSFNPAGMPVPTIILLDELGDIRFHHVGRLDPVALSDLERIIQAGLKQRPF